MHSNPPLRAAPRSSPVAHDRERGAALGRTARGTSTPIIHEATALRKGTARKPIAKEMGKTRDKFLGMERDLAAELLRMWRETCAKALKDIFRDIPAFTSKDAMELLRQSLADTLGPAFGNAIGPKISELTQAALEEGLGRDALAELLHQGLGEAAPGGYTYWDVVASSAIVRARSFRAISGMEEAGITEYEILAMGDERMCPICGALNGTIFSVAETRKVINKALDITDPEKFKEAMPWHKGSPLGKSISGLTAGGQSIPPFHGRCRCTLVTASESSIEKYGDTIEERALHINEFNKAQKIQLLSELADSLGLSYTKDKLRAGEDIYKDDDGYFIHPLNYGAKGEWRSTILRPGDTLVDRYGKSTGNFLSPIGTPFEERALPASFKNKEYHKYMVKDSFRVKESITAPWFDQPGGGIQYMTGEIIGELVDKGYLEEVSE